MSINYSMAGKKATKYITELIDGKTLTGSQAGKVLIYDLINSRTRKENTFEDKQKWAKIYEKIHKDAAKWTRQELQNYKAYQNLQSWILRTYPEALGRNDISQSYIEHFGDITSTIYNAEKIAYLVEDVLKNSPEQKRIEQERAEQKLRSNDGEIGTKDNKFPKEVKIWTNIYAQHYAPRTPLEHFRLLTLDRYTDWRENSDQHYIVGTLEKIYKKRLKENYYYLQGYNKSLEIIAKCIDILELNAIGFELDFFDQFNDCISELREAIAKSNLSKEDRHRKQKAIDDIFSPINFKVFKTPGSKIQKACRLLDKGTAFADGDYEFIDLFTQTDIFDDE
ncbi:MAG: hypothetical protein Nk1A_7120 [Endomicrobiia bacterium]|nr:MAG: hypothetical protein Nk1A_7120 [Endomicrobiia bacterium]